MNLAGFADLSVDQLAVKQLLLLLESLPDGKPLLINC